MGNDVVVIGGGAIGLSVAEALERRGAKVCVLEAEAWGEGASEGNAGWVSPGLSNPVPAPGVMIQALKWMPNPKSPLLIRPTLRPDFLTWSYGFWRATNKARYSAGLAALVALCARSVDDYHALIERGIEVEWHEEGILFIARSPRWLESERTVLNDITALGFDVQLKEMTEQEALEYEPSLRPGFAGALLSPRDCHIRPESLTRGLVARLSERGADLQEGVRVRSIGRDGDGWVVRTESGTTLRAKQVVVAAGVATRRLVEPLGIKLPMEGAKGYSITYDEPSLKLRGSLYLLDAKVAVAPYENALRFAGRLELGAKTREATPGRVQVVEEAARIALKDWAPHGRRKAWAGFRPMTTDGLPVLGPVPGHPGLSVATGHSMLGITLAPTSGELVAEAITEEGPSLELAPFSIARFNNRMPRSPLAALAADTAGGEHAQL